ncbi:uncharacterized protein At2g39795, mitochondrial [Morus notabilis]|nr:uncharacterized protein At2g39795, mitochondrial [Morus notabilis]
MAPLIRPLRKPLLSLSSSSSSSSKILASQLEEQQRPRISLLNPKFSSAQSPRTYISEMRRSTFEGNLLRLLRNEIRYELDRSPLNQPVTKFESFSVDDRPGEKWISLTRKFGDKEDIKIEATMPDGALPGPDSGAVDAAEGDVNLHITLIVNISKEGSDNVLEFLCSAWSDGLEVEKLSIRKCDNVLDKPYGGPECKDLDDQLDDAILEFLEERGINDELAAFVHAYVKNKEKTEFIRWMETVKSFIERK